VFIEFSADTNVVQLTRKADISALSQNWDTLNGIKIFI
jgi:hypothetical protein